MESSVISGTTGCIAVIPVFFLVLFTGLQGTAATFTVGVGLSVAVLVVLGVGLGFWLPRRWYVWPLLAAWPWLLWGFGVYFSRPIPHVNDTRWMGAVIALGAAAALSIGGVLGRLVRAWVTRWSGGRAG